MPLSTVVFLSFPKIHSIYFVKYSVCFSLTYLCNKGTSLGAVRQCDNSFFLLKIRLVPSCDISSLLVYHNESCSEKIITKDLQKLVSCLLKVKVTPLFCSSLLNCLDLQNSSVSMKSCLDLNDCSPVLQHLFWWAAIQPACPRLVCAF